MTSFVWKTFGYVDSALILFVSKLMLPLVNSLLISYMEIKLFLKFLVRELNFISIKTNITHLCKDFDCDSHIIFLSLSI